MQRRILFLAQLMLVVFTDAQPCLSISTLVYSEGAPAGLGTPACSYIQANSAAICNSVISAWAIVNGNACHLRGSGYGCQFSNALQLASPAPSTGSIYCQLALPPPPSPPPPSPSPPPTLVTARNDPHFRLPHGGRTDIRGEDGAIYNLLSAKNVSLSALFEAADFTWSKRSVHGTKMAAAFWVIRTYSNDTVTVSYTAAVHGQERYAIVSVVGAEAMDNKLHVDAAMPFKLSNLAVTLVGRKLIVETDKWQMAASADPFPFAILNKGKVLMNIEVTPKYDADKDVVAPHGIFGQAYDDDEMAVNGAVDSPTGNEWTTKAQGEGAIEGSIAEYKLADGFSTDFKYSRFDAVRAPHRDVSKLTGPKEKRGKGSSARVEHYAEPEPSAAVGSD